jgi:hypothetical protein
MISFLEFSLTIKSEFLDAFRIFCNVRDGQVEKKEEEWKTLFKKFLSKKTN